MRPCNNTNINLKKGGVMVKSRNIQADILSIISDGKTRTYQQIADEIEVHRMTVYKHIKALSFRYNIETFCGGIDRGGVRLNIKKQINLDYLTYDELQFVIDKIMPIQNLTVNLKRFFNSLTKLQ